MLNNGCRLHLICTSEIPRGMRFFFTAEAALIFSVSFVSLFIATKPETLPRPCHILLRFYILLRKMLIRKWIASIDLIVLTNRSWLEFPHDKHKQNAWSNISTDLLYLVSSEMFQHGGRKRLVHRVLQPPFLTPALYCTIQHLCQILCPPLNCFRTFIGLCANTNTCNEIATRFP